MTSLDLALVGNGAIAALIDSRGTVVWCCFPRFDGDPVFGSLLGSDSQSESAGSFAIELVGAVRIEQQYSADTPVLVTRCYDKQGGGIEITDFCPRFESDGNPFCPPVIVRQVRPIGGTPMILVRVAPAADYGCNERKHALGRNSITYAGNPGLTLTTNAPTQAIADKVPFQLHQTLTFMFGLEQEQGDVTSVGAGFLERTEAYWRSWAGSL
ncbi:MAG TPA: trehalase-like domain-containing protein, partial [Gemmatimonadaceae bacterium]|nr:trehalase-like domain-containing protein [Gemmatimonadaceae bacterium]